MIRAQQSSLQLIARRLSAIGGCDARTQRLARSWGLRVRPRIKQRAAERGQAVECFTWNELLRKALACKS